MNDPLWANLKDYVGMVAGGQSKALFVIGEGGLGKTEVTLETLEENGVRHKYFNTFSTPLELYSQLYNHRNDLVVLDDMEGILDNKKSVAILKSCLWGFRDERIVQYMSTTALLTVPPRFEFNGSIIMLLNQYPKNEFVRSLVTRSVYYELKFTYDQKIQLMREISIKDYEGLSLAQRTEIFNFIRVNTSESTQELNFRTLIKAYNIYLYSNERWRELVKLMLRPDEDIATFKTIEDAMGEMTVLQQARLFTIHTGKSRSTYFRLKRKLRTA